MADQVEITKPSRTLVLCFDGTANEYDDDNTNIVNLFSLLKKDDFNQQLCYYQTGVGTWFNPGAVSPLFSWCAKKLDEAFAWYLNEHVMGGYKFLMQNYRVGDKICLFGFSRGAYTARALAGLLFKIGLLPRDNMEQVPFAYKLYKRQDKDGLALAAGYKQTFCQDVRVEFVGVWDTVSSIGVVMGRTLPFVNSNEAIKVFRHALSLDEHRAKYRPSLYHRPDPSVRASTLDPKYVSAEDAPVSPAIGADKTPSVGAGPESEKQNLVQPKLTRFMRKVSTEKGKKRSGSQSSSSSSGGRNAKVMGEKWETDILEVWFTGCHSDVGGGSVKNDQPCLSQISLRWMVRQVMVSQCGILFDQEALARAGLPTSTIDGSSYTEAGEDEMRRDTQNALLGINDQLKKSPIWWLLEILPLSYTWQDAQCNWHTTHMPNFGRGRKILDTQPKFHATVKQRMTDEGAKYKPKAKWTAGTEVYVE